MARYLSRNLFYMKINIGDDWGMNKLGNLCLLILLFSDNEDIQFEVGRLIVWGGMWLASDSDLRLGLGIWN